MDLYKKRPIRFIEIFEADGWQIKLYSISAKQALVPPAYIEAVKAKVPKWLEAAGCYPLDTYRVATLILHEGKEGCFAIISWWIDENMLQLFVYLTPNDQPVEFVLYSDKGIVTCVWEMAVLWHERNAWVEHVLQKASNPDFNAYLKDVLNADV